MSLSKPIMESLVAMGLFYAISGILAIGLCWLYWRTHRESLSVNPQEEDVYPPAVQYPYPCYHPSMFAKYYQASEVVHV